MVRPSYSPLGALTSWLMGLFVFLFSLSTFAAPSFQTTSPSTVAFENQVYIYDADATDSSDPNLTYSIVTAPSGATINSTTGVVTWPVPTATGSFSIKVCNTLNQCATQSWTVTRQIGPAYLVFSAAHLFLWSYENNARYWVHRMSDDSVVEAGTIAVAGRMKFLDLFTKYGINALTGHLYVRIEKPITFLSGSSKQTAGGEATYFHSENNTKVGKVFTGYARSDVAIFCYTSSTTTVSPSLKFTDVSDSDDSKTLTAANATYKGVGKNVNNANSGQYWIWTINSMDDDEFRLEPTNPSLSTNPDCSVLGGVFLTRNDWSQSPPTSAPGENGHSYGTRFYTFVSKELLLFPLQNGTKVRIRSLTNPTGSANTSFTMPASGNNFWTALPFPSTYNGFTQTSPNVPFSLEFVEITSDKPITLIPSALRSVGSYIHSIQLKKRSDGKFEGYCYVNKVTAKTNDIRIMTKDKSTKVEVTSIGGQKNDTTTKFYVGSWTGVSPVQSWQGKTYYYSSSPANWINAELVRVVADKYPVLVVCGDISGTTQLYNVVGNKPPINLPPKITAVPGPKAAAGVPYKPNQVVATDPEGGPLLYSLVKGPTGATISPNAGSVLWTPTTADIGKTFTFTVRVMDNEGNFDTKTWTVTVVVCLNGNVRSCYSGSSGCVKSGQSYNCTGTCKAGTQTCVNEKWPTTCSGDVGPTAETCDGKDNNCDGQTDNNIAVVPNCNNQTGVCKGAKKVCTSGAWQPCDSTSYKGNDASYETTEKTCDGKDNDCDGQTDEGITRACGATDQGACKRGTETCSAGKWGACVGEIKATPEVCDNIDNDCDGQIDEGVTRSCGATDTGACKKGTETCAAGKWGTCVGLVTPKTEVCDGVDNNCDGQVDNNLTAPNCTKQSGACKGAKQTCTGTGGWKDCDAAAYKANNASYEATETKCDGVDNDCDGKVDNNLTAPNCTKQGGVCSGAKQTCTGTGGWKDCDAAAYTKNNADYQATENKCDGKDNDCDGKIDETCLCKPGDKQPCFTGSGGCVKSGSTYTCKGACKAGSQTCNSSGKWGACSGDVAEKVETCDGIDNNCDGQVDNNLNAPNCTKQSGVCSGAKQTCTGSGGWKDCDAAAYKANNADYQATESKCDGKDNDCDGKTDNNLTAPNCTKQAGVCKGAKQTCTGSGGWKDCDDAAYTKNNADYEATETKCDSKDNDCDGQVDEAKKCSSIPPQIKGVPDKTTSETALYSYSPSVVDPDVGDTHVWSANKLPQGAVIDPKTGKVTWTSKVGDAGKEFEFEIKVCDSANLCAVQNWKVFVNKSNALPQIIGTPQQVTKKGDLYTYSPTVRDPDPNDTHTWKLNQGPPGAVIDPKTGKVTWTSKAADVGKVFEFSITVCDAASDCATQRWKVRVVDPNTPPRIVTTPGTGATAGTPYRYKPKVEDPDTGDTHTWSSTKLPTGAKVDPKTGEVTWTPSQADDGKEFEFEIKVCDKSNACATQRWKVRVGKGNRPPAITGNPGTTATSKVVYAFAPGVVDPDVGDTHKWTLNKSPSGASIDANTGRVTWTPTDADRSKFFDFEIQVCDKSNACATLLWTVKVLGQGNTPPVIVGAPSNDGFKGVTYTFAPTVNDPDVGDTHTWKGLKLPTGAKVDPKTGKLTWTPQAGDVGKDFELEIEVCDSKGACSSRKWKVRVFDKRKPPKMGGTPRTWTNPTTLYTFQPFVVDPEPNETYSWKGTILVPGAKVDPKTGKLTWTPKPSDSGKIFEFEIELCDSKNLCTRRKWKVRVLTKPRNTPPQIVSSPPTTATERVPYSYKPVLDDPDVGDKHTWSGKNLPAGATVDPKTGEVKWTPKPGDAGKTFKFELTVCDSGTPKLCDTQTWTVTPSKGNQPPVIVSTPPDRAYAGKEFNYKPAATDPDQGDKHTWKGVKLPAGATVDPKTGELKWTPSTNDVDKEVTITIEVCDDGTPKLCAQQTFRLTPRQPCEVDINCKDPQICVPDSAGQWICQAPVCTNTAKPCPSKTNFCLHGKCEQNTCTNNNCQQGEACRATDGKCFKPCAGVKCNNNENCVDGVCQEDPCKTANLNCKSDELCDTSVPNKPACKKNPCTSKACRHGRVCLPNGRCQEDPCLGVTCPDPTKQRCVLGQCVDVPACNVDIDCDGKKVCIQKRCVEEGCYTKTPQCPQGDMCLSTNCTKKECPNPGGNACKADEFCRPVSNKCIPSCGGVNCNSGEKCVDGACVTDPCANVSCTAGTVCVKGNCEKDHCAASNVCRHGRICSKTENACVDDPCQDVKCPRQGEVCVNGQCVSTGCKLDEDCPGTDLCVKRKCIKRDCVTNSDCAADEICTDGTCGPNPCKDKTCPNGEFCRAGVCVKTCAGVRCEAGKRCLDGECKDDPCANVKCKDTEECVNGKCVPSLCKQGLKQCETGRVCKVDECVDDPCAPIKCPQGQTCDKGQCVGDRTCQVDVDCPGEDVCVNKVCVVPNCYKGSKCESAKLCTDAKCRDNPCDSANCSSDEYCDSRDGSCKKLCPSCPEGQLCKEGACVKDPCADANCKSTETCLDGKCEEDICADTSKSHCRYGRVCSRNQCKDDACQGITCPANQTCRKGICYKVPGETTPEDVNRDAGSQTPEAAANEFIVGGGCGCELSNGKSSLAFWLLLMFAGWLAFVRRKRWMES